MRHHRIETAVYVYLTLDTDSGKWIVDPVTVDGSQLDNTFIDGSECECVRGTSHDEVMDYASTIPLPTGTELIELLKKAVGEQ